jgi:CHAT domain-containing protein
VTAGEWFGTTGQRPLPCPERVLLSACDSSGSSGAGAGEWLGLGTALLAAGAHDVVATAWNLPDWRYTNRFEHRLLRRLTTCSDVAEALADVQREALARWRSGSVTERPIVWAAYQYIGVPARDPNPNVR